MTTTLGLDEVAGKNVLTPTTKTNIQPAMTIHFCLVVGILTVEADLVTRGFWLKAVAGAEACGTET